MMIHKTAEVSERAVIGEGTKIWHYVQVRENARIGENCILGKGVYVDFDVVIGSNVKIQNRASIYHGVVVEDGVFIGPHVCLINDKTPRSITPEGVLKREGDWQVGKILVKYGASIGTGTIVLPDLTIGKFAMVGAGSVVTKSVPDYGLVLGNPARLKGFVCPCGKRLVEEEEEEEVIMMRCLACQTRYPIPRRDVDLVE
jgi:acetyltransferase-like isoleucine patch superfamily enzyme